MPAPLTGQDLVDAIDDIRLLVADNDPFNEVFTDTDYERFLRIEGWVVRLAAAQALETNAANLAQVAGIVRGLLDIRVGGEDSAATLRSIAGDYRRQHAAGRRRRFGTIYARAGLAREGR